MKSLVILTVFMTMLLTISGTAFAQAEKNQKCTSERILSCNAIETFKMGIKSENPGVRRSAIYYAGQYKLAELTPALVKQLKKEQDRTIRILIALSLYKMENSEGARTINRMAETDMDLKVRRICTALSEEIKTGEYQQEIAKLTSR